MDPKLLKQIEAQRSLQNQYGGPAIQESTPTPVQESFMNPQQTEWANMMINSLNQLGGMSTDPSFHRALASEYLGMLGSLQPTTGSSKNEALEMIQLGQALGDNEMSQYGLNALRGLSGMDFIPKLGTSEYSKKVEDEALMKLFEDQFPVVGSEDGSLTEEDIRNLQLQLQAQENPNLVKQYMDAKVSPWNWLSSKETKRKKRAEKAGFNV